MDTYIGFDKLCYNRKKDNDPILPVSRTTIERMVANGEFPQPLRLGTRSLWGRGTIARYLTHRTMDCSSESPYLSSGIGNSSDRSCELAADHAQINPTETA